MPGGEPKLALAVGAYAREHPVVAAPAPGEVIDLGAPEVPAPGEALHDADGYRSPRTAAAVARSGR